MPNRIDALRAELDALRLAYAADPRNHSLEIASARAFQKWHYEATHEAHEQDMADAARSRAEWTARTRDYRPPTNAEFEALLPVTCPGCGHVTRLYSARVGDVGWRCRAGRCTYTGEIEW